ncbi:MAG: GNAT family N-acetyltransferase [Clostridia bacterium]|nr:GNAT family N-acetyltransferase [Clostridia bacterium]
MSGAGSPKYAIRRLRENEVGLLKDLLYEAIFVPEGALPPDRSVTERPELRVYWEGFGSGAADHCLVAEADGRPVGAVWTRIMNDYGHVDDETPSFAISLYREYRGLGLGTAMMTKMLDILRAEGYKRASLSVQKANRAVGLYRSVGFRVLEENAEEYIMVCTLQPRLHTGTAFPGSPRDQSQSS